MDATNVIALLSGVALFLFGMSLMGDGLKRVAGSKLELVLYRLTNSTWKGILLGAGVTAVIQSSSATSVMVVGFVNSGMMKLRQAIGIILGAILGTSITGWIICLSSLEGGSGWVKLVSTSTITGVVAVVGIVLRMAGKNPTAVHVGDILMGFAVLMFGMSAMSGAVAPLQESEEFIRIFTSFSQPVLGILVGALFTCVLQSASAAVGILQALAMTGAVNFAVALPIIMGIGIGAALPVLLSALGANTSGRRTAFVYLLIDVIGAVFWAIVFYGVNAIWPLAILDEIMTPVSVAALNTIFRLATLIVLTPFIGLLEKLSCLIIKGKPEPVTEPETALLEERFLQHPALAVEQSRTVINAMAAKARENLLDAFSLLDNYTDERFEKVRADEDSVDRYEDRLGTYLVKITAQELTAKQNEEVSKFLHTLSDIERISDHAMNIAETAREIHEKAMVFSEEGRHELSVMQAAVTEILQITVDAFVENDVEQAAKVEPLEDLIDDLCDELKLHHVDRLQKGKCTLSQGFVFNDLLTNYERVSDHCSNIAVAMIELESDAFDTHEYVNSLKQLKLESFARYFEEFREKYRI
ncbi:MAG: Na/Pi cotransporter family protein [Candidatus Enterenecus sp.]